MGHDSPWFADRAATERPGPEALPDHAEVVVIGGGLAGVATALFLAEGGASPLLLEARDDVGHGASGQHPGLVFPATPEPPFRLLHALGEEHTRELFTFSRENLALLEERVPVDRCGSLWIAVDDREPAQLEESLQALDTVGVPAELWSAGQVADRVGGDGLGPALHLPEDALIDPLDTVRRLADAAVEAGATVLVHCPVTGLDRTVDEVQVHLGTRTITADAVVCAANPWLPGIHEYFDGKITPFREQALATAPVEPRFDLGLRAQYGYFTWRQDPAGRVLMRGARWATQHMEVGETSEAPIDRVQEKIQGFLHAKFPDLAEVAIERRWAWIEASSCDGLPIVGPLPGSVRFLACAGFNGNQPGLGVRAARAVADGLLTGQAEGVPAYLAPGRFV